MNQISAGIATGFTRFALAAGMLAASTLPGFARMDVRQMTCSQAQQLVQSQRAVVLTLTNATYDRIVRHEMFCDPMTVGENVFATTRDSERCLIGQRCVIGDRFDVDDDY
jgi:hypothetical protein